LTNGTAFLVNDIGKITKIFSIALVMGISSAHAILRSVQDDFIESSGVYAIVDSSPFFKRKKSGCLKDNRPFF